MENGGASARDSPPRPHHDLQVDAGLGQARRGRVEKRSRLIRLGGQSKLPTTIARRGTVASIVRWFTRGPIIARRQKGTGRPAVRVRRSRQSSGASEVTKVGFTSSRPPAGRFDRIEFLRHPPDAARLGDAPRHRDLALCAIWTRRGGADCGADDAAPRRAPSRCRCCRRPRRPRSRPRARSTAARPAGEETRRQPGKHDSTRRQDGRRCLSHGAATPSRSLSRGLAFRSREPDHMERAPAGLRP